jgi:hypothetical protein
MARSVARGDYTGKESERLQKEHAEELLERSGKIGLVNQPPAADVDGIFDPFTSEPVEANGAREEVLDGDQTPIEYMGGFGGDGGYRVLRVNTNIEDMTYGVGNTFSLERGKRYRVSEDLYDWLASKGLVLS